MGDLYADGLIGSFNQGSFTTQYVAYVLGTPNDQPIDFQDGTAQIYAVQPQVFFAQGYATFGSGSAYFSFEPLGAFEDFTIYPEGQSDPVTGFVLADNSGTLTGLGQTWSRHYRVLVPPKGARYAVPHIQFGSVPVGVTQYLDAHMLEVVQIGQTLPSPFMSARSIKAKVRPTRLNYYAGSTHVTGLRPDQTYIASATVAGQRVSYTDDADAFGSIDLTFANTATHIMVEEGTVLRDYFDGNSGPDYLWENGATSGRSYFYPDRSMRHFVLVRNLQENVAIGVTVEEPEYAGVVSGGDVGGNVSGYGNEPYGLGTYGA